MPKLLLIEEFQVSLRVPAALPDGEADRVRRLLGGPSFRTQLRQALKDLLDRQLILDQVRLGITR